jgi:3-dehydroquinate synthetase
MTARTIVSLSRNPYEIIVGNGILDRTGEFVREILAPAKCAVITDTNIAPLYCDAVVAAPGTPVSALWWSRFPPGKSKSLETTGKSATE